jgi:hypothetical protein
LVTVTRTARLNCVSLAEELIPRPQELLSVLFHKALDTSKFAAAKPAAALKTHRIQPKLCRFVIALDMNVCGLIAVARVKVESVRPRAQNGWHWFASAIESTDTSLPPRRQRSACSTLCALTFRLLKGLRNPRGSAP